MFNEISFRYLTRDGKCCLCAKKIKANGEKVIYFDNCKSQATSVTLCVECLNKINTVVKENNNA